MKEITIEIGDELPCPWCDRTNGQVIAKVFKIKDLSKEITTVKEIYLDCEYKHIITVWKNKKNHLE
jgi:hypothetical protein